VGLKLLLKRGALLAAANWQTIAIQFAAQATFQAMLAVPLIGAAVLVAVLLGADLANLLEGEFRDILRTVTGLLTAEPIALGGFIAAFGIALVGGSVFMLLVKGGTVHVLTAANDASGPIEQEPVTLEGLRPAAVFSMNRFLEGCSRLFRRYLALGMVVTVVYGLTAVSYLMFLVIGYRAARGGSIVGWAFLAATSSIVLVVWVTLVNLFYLLVQIALAVGEGGLVDAARAVARFARGEFRQLSALFFVFLAVVVGATLVSALAWSGVGLIAFVPLVGLAVFPLQIAALILRGLVFEYIGLTSLGAYLTLYRRPAVAPGSAALRWEPAGSHD
jgi:hypothetical protein